MLIVDGEEYLTGAEAAALLGVKTATLYAYVSRGIVRSYRQGMRRARLYRRSELERLTRIAPSTPRGGNVVPIDAAARRRRLPQIPTAESWIRD